MWLNWLEQSKIPARCLPLIDIHSLNDDRPLNGAWHQLQQPGQVQLVVFVSPNAVEQFFKARPTACLWPATCQIGSIGPGTTAALQAQGVGLSQIVQPVRDAVQFDSEALWQQLIDQSWAGTSAWIVRGTKGREWLGQQLEQSGASVYYLSAYSRQTPCWSQQERDLFQAALKQPRHYLWLFSSSQCIEELQIRIPHVTAAAAVYMGSVAICTHPRIEARAREAGFRHTFCTRPDFPAVLACIQSS
jgi:uroporphyrinogen-III synthase